MKHVGLIVFCLFAVSAAVAEDFSVENQSMRRTLAIEDGRLLTKAIENKLAGVTATPTACDEFRLRISQGTHTEGTDVLLTASDFVASHVSGGKSLQVFRLNNRKHGLEVEVRYELAAQDFYARKQLVVTAKKPVTLERIDVEAIAFTDANQPYKLKVINSRGKWSPGIGQPLFTTNTATFWGIEFPAAYNHVDGETMFAGYLWGFELKPGTPYRSKKAVVGVADDPQFNQDAFFDYIDRVRARPLRLQTQYNSWFNGGRSVTRERFKTSIETIHRELNVERGVKPLRAYVIDDGWQDVHVDWTDKTWKVNAKFDDDFARSLANAANAGSSLGLWMSPGCNFGARRAVPRYREAGFEALDNYMSLAGPKYMGLLEARMVELAKLGIAYFKLDGLFGHLNTRDFELNGARYGIPSMPQLGTEGLGTADPALNDPKYDELKTYYLAAGAERLIQIFDKMGAVNPDIYIVISNGAWLSPWWLMHIDAVWMINAGDAARGADRTKELTYRDGVYHEIYAGEDTQYPVHSLFNHEPKKKSTGESKKSFRDYLYMNMSRGTGFVELYIKPGILQEPDWDVLAEGLLWVHDVFPLFKRARMHGGNPRENETYGYTAWDKTRGFISIHNPSDETRKYEVVLNRAFGLVPGSSTFKLSSPLTESVDGLKAKWSFGDTLAVTLKPREIRILNFDPVVRDWSVLHELQRRNPEPVPSAAPASTKPAAEAVPPSEAFRGTWEYMAGNTPYSREFTKDGNCILLRDKALNWKKRITACNGNVLVVDGKYKHVLQPDGTLKIEGRYTAVKKAK